ncbi:TetR/AcrR family transcriptional regulator [Stenotrophomonas sp.]|uniref:TetR/AcrR family transcriptional regulator n=1 Tax=Stenotrophomonas sp. TaxID=69392 RepID=UPI00289E4AAE|nr:TetR/AcrR family transcriptional regulator [Stenotrophomonas sp.]
MRTSNRTRILEAAVRVINRDGVRGVTFESVSAESRLTRGGLLYHFPSREALLQGIDAHLVQTWEAQMEALAGKPADQTTQHERYQAFIRVSALSATRAELMFMLESIPADAEFAPWSEAIARWAPAVPKAGDGSPEALDAFVARLAADGLWIYEAMYGGKLDGDTRQLLVKRIEQLLL